MQVKFKATQHDQMPNLAKFSQPKKVAEIKLFER